MRAPGVLLALAALVAAGPAAAQERPRLAVVVSVDQMRPDTLARFAKEYEGGLKRLLERGARFSGEIDHAMTATGPGHATMLTGCHPARHGIVGNRWLDRGTLVPVYCVADHAPALLLRDALGDWMKARDPRAQVYAVSGKDRAAILMAGRAPDGCFWLDRLGGGFTTSAAYCPDGFPAWLRAFNDDGWLDALPEHWAYEPDPSLRADDDPRESPRLGRASPHPLRGATRAQTIDRVYRSPFADAFAVRLACALVERFDLGGDEACDLLAVSLSATDTVGHLYGPFSQEIRDTVLRADRALGDLFALLDARGVPFVVALTADHGVLPLDGARRFDVGRMMRVLETALAKRFGQGNLLRMVHADVYVDRKAARARGIDPDEVVAAARDLLATVPEVAAVFTAADLADRGGPDADAGDAGGKEVGDGESNLRRLVRNSYHPDRSGDLYVVLREGLLPGAFGGTGTTHGSPWRYDREVPFVIAGPGVRPGLRDATARSVDLAPTLARLLGVPVPAGLDGRALPLE